MCVLPSALASEYVRAGVCACASVCVCVCVCFSNMELYIPTKGFSVI